MKINRLAIKILAGALPEIGPGKYQALRSALSGFSLFVQAESAEKTYRILMDTSSSWVGLRRQSARWGIELDNLDAVFISHWHFGHAFALPILARFLPQETGVIVPQYPPSRQLANLGIEYLLPAGWHPKAYDRPGEIFPGIYTTGGLAYRFPGSVALLREQALVFSVEEMGLVILTGCAHPGLPAILEAAVNIAGEKRIDLLMGGFHYYSFPESAEEAKPDLSGLKQWEISRIAPCYCTGEKAVEEIAALLPQGFRWVRQGGEIISQKGMLE